LKVQMTKVYTWKELNLALRKATKEEEVLFMLRQEQASRFPRKRWMQRIHARYRRLRLRREQKEVARLGNS
jgi:hypothetical protein